jgi:hypothetical protein
MARSKWDLGLNDVKLMHEPDIETTMSEETCSLALLFCQPCTPYNPGIRVSGRIVVLVGIYSRESRVFKAAMGESIRFLVIT